MRGMRFSRIEIRDLAKAWFAITLAFTIVLAGTGKGFLTYLLIYGVAVGISFLCHELGHKFVAQRYHLWAEFRSFDFMLIVAVACSFLGFVFAAPGAVMISGHMDVKKNGKISLMGPLTNIILAVAFIMAFFASAQLGLASELVRNAMLLGGFKINSWLALFNLLPFGNFDGTKILKWSKPVYAAMVVVCCIMMGISGLL
jgi:Zn-dependent protease